jgi:hypothetical protein
MLPADSAGRTHGTGESQTGFSVPTPGVAAIHPARVDIPLAFIVTGILSLLAGSIWLIFRPELLASYHYNQYIVAVTHLFVLGWICSVFIGSLYQLAPVALETKLHSPRLARWHYLLHVIGFGGMVSMLWIWNMAGVALFGAAFALGVLLFGYNLGRTLKRIPSWNVTAFAVALALFWLVMTVLAGLYLAAGKLWPISLSEPISQMHAHAHMGAMGAFVLLIVGVSYKLVPMFALSEVQNRRRAWISVIILNAAVAGLFLTIFANHAWKFGFALLGVSALIVYGLEMRAILRARKRRVLDLGLKSFLAALTFLVPLSLLAVVLAWPGLELTETVGRLENLYGYLALLGLVTLAMLGMLYKIVPFLVWYSCYSKEIGRAKVPALAELYSARLQGWGHWMFVAGLAITSAAILLGSTPLARGGSAVVAAGLCLFALNMGAILWHLYRPRIERRRATPSAIST